MTPQRTIQNMRAKPRKVITILLVALGFWILSPILMSSSVKAESFAQAHSVGSSAEQGKEASSGAKETMFKWFNFAILAGALLFFLWKPFQQFFESRASGIKKSLEDARAARAHAGHELSKVREKLGQLEQEVAALKKAAAVEAEAERHRILTEAHAEAEQLIAAAQEEVERLMKRGRKELREYAAALAVQMAEQKIRAQIRPEDQGMLFKQFLASLDSMERQK